MRSLSSGLDSLKKSCAIADPVIDGSRKNDRIWIAFHRDQRGDGDGRGGIPSDRLENDSGVIHAGLAELLADNETMLGVGNHDGACEYRVIRGPQRRLLQQRLFAEKRQKLFRISLSGERP